MADSDARRPLHEGSTKREKQRHAEPAIATIPRPNWVSGKSNYCLHLQSYVNLMHTYWMNHLCCSWGQHVDLWKEMGCPARMAQVYSVYFCVTRGWLPWMVASMTSWLTSSKMPKQNRRCSSIVCLSPAKWLHVWKMAARGLVRSHPGLKVCMFVVSVSIKKSVIETLEETRTTTASKHIRDITILIGQRSICLY